MLSPLIEGLKQRRSIRRYQNKPVPKELLKLLIEAASYAPSAHNAQPWRFIIITEDENKCNLANAMGEVWLEELRADGIPQRVREAFVRASVERFSNAPALILACLTLEDMEKYPDEQRQNYERDLAGQSVGAAIQNLLLAACAEGLGACWYCAPVFCKTAAKTALGLPDDVDPQALITLGYPNESPQMPPRKSTEEIASAEQWDTLL
jgi:F420 biosynthesis protein FbiB-like protein